MIIPDFAINLGNGLFIDSTGKLTSSIPDHIAQFSPSQPLPIPKEAVQDVFGAMGHVFPQLEKIGANLEVKDADLFKALGMSKELIETFGKVGEIAMGVAACIPYVNIAVALLNILGVFNGPDPLGELIKEEFNRLHERLDKADRDKVDNYIAFCRSAFDPALTAVAQYQTVMSKPKAYRGPGEAENKRTAAQERLFEVQEKLTDALLHSWALPLNTQDYFDNWYYMQSYLYTIPTSGPPRPAHFPAEAVPFDHRPMVQLLVYGLQVYVTLIKAVVPEHRTTGQYHTALRAAADKLSAQIEKMREQTLARTIHKAGVPSFKQTHRQFFLLTVGAMDLRNDTDDYFRMSHDPSDYNHTGNLRVQNAPGIPNKGTAVQVDGDVWWTINPAAVELANKQSEREYAALLTRSGYFTLAHLEALMRHLSTEPDRSETVTATAETLRKSLPASNVPVKNDKIPFSPPIEATASREPQDCKAYVSLTTQPIPSDSAIGYRIRLVTLPDGTTETPFDWYVWTSYVPDGPRNRKLAVNVNDGMPLDPVGNNPRLLVDNISPANPIEKKGSVTLTADTFDWYIPKTDDPLAFARIQDLVKLGVGAGVGTGAGAKPIPMPPPAPGNGSSLTSARILKSIDVGVAGTFGWDDDAQMPKGEKREWQRKQVQLDYELYWHEDHLSLTLKARPQDRNYVAYLVVEEFLARSQQWLRTAVQIRFNGQLTYVPQSFFDAERKAMERANGILGEIEKNYSISRRPGPLDPVVASMRPGFRSTLEGMEVFLEAARQHAPEVVNEVLSQRTAEAV